MALNPDAHQPYADPAEFIIEWTERIWGGRGVGLIRQNYAEDAIIHTAFGTTVGHESVVRSTLARIAQFPDRIGAAEDVVWEPRGSRGFVSSHRALHIGTHSGTSLYGPPTYLPFAARGIAHCLYVGGRMEQEWLVRDELAIVLALGLDPDHIARQVPFTGWDGGLQDPPHAPKSAGDSGPRADDHAAEVELVLALVREVWNRHEYDRLSDFVIRDVFCHTVPHRTLVRPAGYVTGLLSLYAPFPDARVEVRDVVAHDAPERGGVRVAISWLLRGHYTGTNLFGPTTGSPVAVLGASQFLVEREKIAAEWRVYDEIALRAQILGARGEAGRRRQVRGPKPRMRLLSRVWLIKPWRRTDCWDGVG